MKKDIFSILRSDEYEVQANERLTKVSALREKFGYYFFNSYPEAIEKFDELMQDEVPEPYRTLAEEEIKRKEKVFRF